MLPLKLHNYDDPFDCTCARSKPWWVCSQLQWNETNKKIPKEVLMKNDSKALRAIAEEDESMEVPNGKKVRAWYILFLLHRIFPNSLNSALLGFPGHGLFRGLKAVSLTSVSCSDLGCLEQADVVKTFLGLIIIQPWGWPEDLSTLPKLTLTSCMNIMRIVMSNLRRGFTRINYTIQYFSWL